MSLLDPDIERYVIASASRILEPVITALSFKYWVGSIDFDESENVIEPNCVLRVVGPVFNPRGGEDRYDFELYVLCTDLLDNKTNAYNLSKVTGTIASTLAAPLPINRWGDGDALIGCLDVNPDAREFVRVVNYGIIEKDTRVKQAGVIARYTISF